MLVREASVREQIIPAVYKTLPQRVLVSPEKVVKKSVPAKTKLVRVKKVIEPATEKRVLVQPKFKTVNKRVVMRKSFSEWRPILCNTNASRSSIKQIQNRLRQSGYYKGPIDGLYGRQTSTAVTKYQARNNLASGGLTKETLNKLKVRWPSESLNL